jgi:hypothetical protein
MMALGWALIGLLGTQAPALSAEDVRHWLKCYYLTPRPELAMAALQAMDRELAREGKSLAARRDLRTFYGRLFAANPKMAPEASAALGTMPEGERLFVLAALRLCGTPTCVKALPTAAGQQSLDDPAYSVADTAVLDSWAAFYATGDAKYVRQVVDALPSAEMGPETDVLRAGGTPELSLLSTAYENRRVLSILEAEMATTRDPAKRVLKAIIERAKSDRAKSPPPELNCERRPTTRIWTPPSRG